MDGSFLIGWAVIIGIGYLCWPAFRREVNGWLVKLADKVKGESDMPAWRKDGTPEAAAWQLYLLDRTDPMQKVKGWNYLPSSVQQRYLDKVAARGLAS